MSWVFFTPHGVLKLKKPVRFPFLDFSTLAAREFNCREELRLNARLAPGVYQGLLALQWLDGRFALVSEADVRNPPGEPLQTVDWLVQMRRLPQDRMLDHMLATGQLTPAHIDALVGVLCSFYRQAAAAPISPQAYADRMRAEQAANREVLLRPQFQLNGTAEALGAFDRALVRGTALLYERAAHGHVIDGHGDLRLEHVCLLDPPVVIDCLEFNVSLRQVDPFDELAFLALECRLAGAAWIGAQLLAGCANGLADSPPSGLMPLYTAHRALLRARLVMAHLLDPAPRTPERWAPMARAYLGCAQEAVGAFEAVFR